MKTLVTADLHLSDNPRDAYRLRWFERLPQLAREYSAGRVLILGDITEAKDGHRAGLVNAIVDGFAALAEVAQVYALCGNHDYVAEDVPFYKFLRHLRRVHWINAATGLELRGLGRCLFLPHTPRPFREEYSIPARPHNWIFCHQTFGGADLGGRAAPGEPPPFPPDARVISGDVHVPQTIGPVTYVGAPYRVDFGDEYKPRVLLLDSDAARSIPSKGPQKRLIVLSGRDPLGGLDIRGRPIRAGDIIKVRVELPPGSDITRAQARTAVAAWVEGAKAHLHAVQVVASRAGESARKAHAARRRSSDEDLICAYARQMGKGKGTIASGLKIAGEVA